MNYSKFLLLFLLIWQVNAIGFAQPKILTENQCVPALDTLDGQEVLQFVEKMPEFEGGIFAFITWFAKNLTITREGRRMDVEGRYVFTFIIDTLGQMRNFCIIKPNPNYVFMDNKPISELNQKKLWKAGEHKGKKVAVRVMIAISCLKMG